MKDNPAKIFLRRYRALCGRVDALTRAIDDAMERAHVTGIALKEKVQSSPAEHDPMAARVAEAIDAAEILMQTRVQCSRALAAILSAIDSVRDESQREVLTRRYINGQDFASISDSMHCSQTQVYVLHGRALVAVNRWLEGRHDHDDCTV